MRKSGWSSSTSPACRGRSPPPNRATSPSRERTPPPGGARTRRRLRAPGRAGRRRPGLGPALDLRPRPQVLEDRAVAGAGPGLRRRARLALSGLGGILAGPAPGEASDAAADAVIGDPFDQAEDRAPDAQ